MSIEKGTPLIHTKLKVIPGYPVYLRVLECLRQYAAFAEFVVGMQIETLYKTPCQPRLEGRSGKSHEILGNHLHISLLICVPLSCRIQRPNSPTAIGTGRNQRRGYATGRPIPYESATKSTNHVHRHLLATSKPRIALNRHSPDGWAFWAVFCPVGAFRNKNGVVAP